MAANEPPIWEAAFLKALERCGVASEAAAATGTGVRNAFKRRKGNATFAAAWDAAVALHRSEAGRRALSAVTSEGIASRQAPGGARLERAGQSRWSKRGEEAFLTELTVSGSVRRAALAAGFSTTAIYKQRAKSRYFADAWDAALETGKARVQAYLVEAATRTFDPDELPIGDEREVDRVSISEAINIAKLPARSGGGPAAGGYTRGGKGLEDRIYDETGFDCTPITREEWEEARQNVIDRLERLREKTEEKERETGRCYFCGQVLPESAEA